MADYSEIIHKITPTQWVLIAGGGIGLGLLLRMRKKAQTPTATTDQGFDTSQYSGTGQTGYVQGNAYTPLYDPNQVSNAPTPPIPVTVPPTPPVPVYTTSPFTPGSRPAMGNVGIPVYTPPAPTVTAPVPIATPPPAQVAPTVMSQGMYLGAFLPQNVAAFTAPGGYLDKFFQNPSQYQIIGGTGTPATTSQVLADLQARGIPISPSWKAIN